ncbi:hypothetical protein F0562_007277 [Nyssa sinensis]|uniref:GAG-pre-integrase domain-containing protein n=1 Tax=Nyssa sinensis TaxID=561372 RepID=A0A5J5A4M7_9ASTE|nr:hypothetical protein F0562_007277 [Nyssa sinensis]
MTTSRFRSGNSQPTRGRGKGGSTYRGRFTYRGGRSGGSGGSGRFYQNNPQAQTQNQFQMQTRSSNHVFGKTPPAHLPVMATSYEHPLPINNLWLTDSGASNHITSDMSNLTITKDYNGDEMVSIGRILHKSKCKDGLYPLHSTNQSIQPPINQHNRNDHNKLTKLQKPSSLYPTCTTSIVVSSIIKANQGKLVSYDLWHNRLGHPSNQVLNKALQQLPSATINKDFKSVC